MEFTTKTRYFIQVKSGAKVYFESLEKAENGFENMPKNINEWILGKEIVITQDLKAGKRTESRTENIVCPECGLTQKAIVLHTEPFHTYIHDCIRCGYKIMESEWVKAK